MLSKIGNKLSISLQGLDGSQARKQNAGAQGPSLGKTGSVGIDWRPSPNAEAIINRLEAIGISTNWNIGVRSTQWEGGRGFREWDGTGPRFVTFTDKPWIDHKVAVAAIQANATEGMPLKFDNFFGVAELAPWPQTGPLMLGFILKEGASGMLRELIRSGEVKVCGPVVGEAPPKAPGPWHTESLPARPELDT